jgi:hypothetical protein
MLVRVCLNFADFANALGAPDERYRDDVWSEFDLTLYHTYSRVAC